MHWTIIGGGLQGTTIAIQLRELGLSRDKLTIIDPYATLCEQFNDFFSSYQHALFAFTNCTSHPPNPFHFKTIR